MTFRIEFHGEVSKEYNEAYDWYEQQKPGLGERFLSAVSFSHCLSHSLIIRSHTDSFIPSIWLVKGKTGI